jgi:hypothetical protein
MDSSQQEQPDRLPPVSRRTFVTLALSSAMAGLLAACRQAVGISTATPAPVSVAGAQPTLTPVPPTSTTTPMPLPPTPTPTAIPTTTATPTPTSDLPSPASTVQSPTSTSTYTPVPATPISPPPPTATPVAVPDRATLMAHWPATAKSRVVVVRHGGVWAGDVPDPAIVLQMLDTGLSTLSGVPGVATVWRTLFDPGERVLLKVNCIAYGGPTQPAVAYAVAQRLQEAGLRAENILLFDRTDRELQAAGYTLNDGGSGLQCHGSRGGGTEIQLTQARVRFFQEIDACDALVNLPTPKQHDTSGVSVSLKNHYGSVDNPGALHGRRCDPAIAELNAQPAICDKTRLIVGAALNVSPRDWNRPERENALLLSFAPVALDTVARDILVRHLQDRGDDAGFLIEGSRHLQTAQALNLGATDPSLIDLREVTL